MLIFITCVLNCYLPVYVVPMSRPTNELAREVDSRNAILTDDKLIDYHDGLGNRAVPAFPVCMCLWCFGGNPLTWKRRCYFKAEVTLTEWRYCVFSRSEMKVRETEIFPPSPVSEALTLIYNMKTEKSLTYAVANCFALG